MNRKNIIFGLCMIAATPLCAMELSDPDRFVELEGKADAFKQFYKSQMNLKKAYADAIEKKGVKDKLKYSNMTNKIQQLLMPEKSQKELENLPSDELKKMAKERDAMVERIQIKIRIKGMLPHPRFATKAEETGWFSWWK